jgi:hypothetical protein
MFGAGETGPSTNVYERHWDIGFFQIRVITWPRELNRPGNNSFEGKNPYLWISAKIYIEPEFPFIHKTEDASTPLEVLIEELPGVVIEGKSQVYARRNRVRASAETRLAGRSADGDFLIRTADRTVRVPTAQIERVKHLRKTPERFPGSSSIDLETTFLNRHPVSVRVATGALTDSLDTIAPRLAGSLKKRLVVEEFPDE